MPGDPFTPPPPPPVERLNRTVLLAAALIVMVTLLVVAFLAAPRVTPHATQPARPALAAGAPGFLNRPPGNLPAPPPGALSDQEYLRNLLQRAAPAPAAADGAFPPFPAAPALPPAGGSVAGGPAAAAGLAVPSAATSRDARRESFLRALRAPLAEPVAPVLPGHAGLPPPPDATALAGGGDAATPTSGDDATPARSLGRAAAPPTTPGAHAGGATGPPPVLVPPAATLAYAPRAAAPGADRDAGGESRDSGALPARFRPPAGGATLAAGTLIPALLETEVNSDLPGPLLAQVSRDVYDRELRQVVLPRGTRLLGRYANQVAVGQSRLLVAWTRLTLPDGAAFELPGLPGLDPSGAAGLTAGVQNHYLRLFGDALLLSLLSAAADLSQPQGTAITAAPSAGSVAAAAVGQELASVGVQLLRRDVSIQPTLHLAAGAPLLVFVNGDLSLDRPASSTGSRQP